MILNLLLIKDWPLVNSGMASVSRWAQELGLISKWLLIITDLLLIKEMLKVKSSMESDLIIIDEVSMLTPWLAMSVSRILGWIADSDEVFGGKKVLFVGDLLQLPLVVPNFDMPVGQRSLAESRWWGQAQKFRPARLMRATHPGWNVFLFNIAHGTGGAVRTWRDLTALGVMVTEEVDVAMAFFLDAVVPAAEFPLDRQWIAATNQLSNEVNLKVQEWRRAGGAAALGVARARHELEISLAEPARLSKQLQLDYVAQLESPDLPPPELEILQGDVLLLMRNVNTRE
jgi:hypothetical protein